MLHDIGQANQLTDVHIALIAGEQRSESDRKAQKEADLPSNLRKGVVGRVHIDDGHRSVQSSERMTSPATEKGTEKHELTYRWIAFMNCCMPWQYVDLPEPGGPITICPKLIARLHSPVQRRERVSNSKAGAKPEIHPQYCREADSEEAKKRELNV
jgi:hypothetical protein